MLAQYQAITSMKNAANVVLVLVTAPDLKVARRLARAVLEDRLIACANLVPRIESLYWWQGRTENSREVLIVMKTTTGRLSALEKRVVELHPYDTPEILAVPVRSGMPAYLAWLKKSVCS
jgi:periplasmic divalent cation tolerance protein